MARTRTTQDAIELLLTDTSPARATECIIEVLQGYTVGAAPTGSFGVAVTADCAEVLMTTVSNARLGRVCVEVLYADGVDTGGGSGGTSSFGYAV